MNLAPSLLSVFDANSSKKWGTSVLFINHDCQVLLFLRDDKKGIPYPNCWDALGGNVEDGETPLECIVREMREELEIDLVAPMLFDVYDMPDRVEYVFWKHEGFESQQLALNEGQRLRWFTELEIRCLAEESVAFGFKAVFLDFFARGPL